jgi:cytochrome c553
MTVRAAICIGILLLLGTAAFAGTMHTAADGSELAAPCASCHRADGRNSGIPSLSGLNENQILQRMSYFRQQTHGDQIMHVVANALTPQETEAVARYVATHPAPAARP